MNTKLDDLKHIRSMMERSSKFLSLSGFSGVSAGLIALAGAGAAHCRMKGHYAITSDVVTDLFLLAVAVIALAGGAGLFFSLRKARKSGAKFWMPVTWQIVKDFAIPMIVGGIFCLLLMYQGATRMVAASMLIFYGLALIQAGARTYRDIRILGACEIILGLLAGFFVYNGLLFWSIGFGLMHIIYGIVMYIKYDKSEKKA
ncbi:hypothetical protein [Dysgonomonas sp. 25]|uniref:hypothetical protein n=1 Tax=Dysgonomonas sp. 25 TaxID=2302933 RepID=UPI0013D87A57|nr:hypothetical protein [Dysgonomonas sp. 25]NDV69603.1 hypothetical protein [Dysgonomonas sp. 25]